MAVVDSFKNQDFPSPGVTRPKSEMWFSVSNGEDQYHVCGYWLLGKHGPSVSFATFERPSRWVRFWTWFFLGWRWEEEVKA